MIYYDIDYIEYFDKKNNFGNVLRNYQFPLKFRKCYRLM